MASWLISLIKQGLCISYAWWTNKVYFRISGVDYYVQLYPEVRCHCGQPTMKVDSGDIYEYQCAHLVPGRACLFTKYERKVRNA